MIRTRPSYQDISLYSPDRAPCRLDLSDNTNLWGIPPAAEEALRSADAAKVTRYPNLYSQPLKEAIAEYIGVSADEVVTGCGSDDVLDSAVRAFALPGERLCYPDPSFAMMPYFAKMNGLEGVSVPLKEDFSVDALAMLETKPRILYFCSPNNPTGTLVDAKSMEAALGLPDTLVMIDEAYAEYATRSWTKAATQRDALLSIRTFSKAFGLAGLRVGYAVGKKELVQEVEKSRGPYKVNGLAELLALTALREDLPWVKDKIERVKKNRERFANALLVAGFSVIPSEANFILVKVKESTQTAKRMRDKGVGIRPFGKIPQQGAEALRISIGPWELMEEALQMLKEEAAPCE